MARGSTLSTLISDLRATLKRSTSVSVGVDDRENLVVRLNQAYEMLYLQHDWPHLRKVFLLDLEAGERYYDFPAGLDPERVEEAAVYFNDQPQRFERGIDFSDYAEFDSDQDDRSEPALKWDIRFTGTGEQIEIWPIPSTNDQYVRFQGIQAVEPLVNNDDTCRLDGTLVVLFAAAAIAPDGKQGGMTNLQMAQDHLRSLKARSKGGLKAYRLGLGVQEPIEAGRVTVRVR